MSRATPPMPSTKRPEVLAPAGDRAALDAAVAAGADAVYLGLTGFNARARAENFDADALRGAVAHAHRHGVKVFVTLNTLVFDDELEAMAQAIRTVAAAGADAVIVQDPATARLAQAIAPSLPIHASTQMTCTDPSSVAMAEELGARRVVVARELSLADIARIREASAVELEVFVHGALCVAYSGQCLTSEAIGGRSANRGACAQACRLPYRLVVDGELRGEDDDRAYLLSPEDLEATAQVDELSRLGVASLKIEGRLKGPAYVAATTALYRKAVDAAAGDGEGASPRERERALQMFSRGSGPGFLEGVDHQRLVEGRACDHRGTQVGALRAVVKHRGKRWLDLDLSAPLARGDGILVEGGWAGEAEQGGRVWALESPRGELSAAEAGERVRVWLGPDVSPDGSALRAGRRVWKTNDPAAEREVLAAADRAPFRVSLDVRVSGRAGEPLVLEATSARGASAHVASTIALSPAERAPLDETTLREKIGKLGDTPFALRHLDVALEGALHLPLSELNRTRRALADALAAPAESFAHEATAATAQSVRDAAPRPSTPPPPPGLFVLCRRLDQAEAALDAGADGVYLDFLELTGTGAAFRALAARSPRPLIGVAPPRIRKPGEEKIDRFLHGLEPDAVLVRGWGALREVASSGRFAVADFSLNVANSITAREVLARGVSAFTPSFDLDAGQLLALIEGELAPYAEAVVHHPMALFHMEHCVFAAMLSEGKNHLDCGRPCERHVVSLRDRAGMDHPLEADVGCRNTVFHARPQSAAHLVGELTRRGVGRFRIELVRESAEREVGAIVRAYRSLLDGTATADAVTQRLRIEQGYGVVKGSLRVLA